MPGFFFDASEFEQFVPNLDTIAQNIKKNERAAVNLAGNEYKSDVQRIAPYKTGTYRRSMHVEPSEENLHPISLVGTDAIQAKQLEFGGVINAKNAPYLVFQIDGQWIQTKSVYQPPKPHWRPAFELNREKYGRIIIDALYHTNTASEDWFISGEY